MIDFTKAYTYHINQDLIERFWRKKGMPNHLTRKDFGVIYRIKKTLHGELIIL